MQNPRLAGVREISQPVQAPPAQPPAQPPAKPPAQPAAQNRPNIPGPAAPTRAKTRHFGLVFSFLLLVLAPIAGAGWYLYTIAQDQYASYVGFSVRSEDPASAAELLGGLSSLSGSSSSDTDILYEFIHSQELIEDINGEVDLVTMFSRPEFDPIFAYDASGTIEDLVNYWPRMVRVEYDSRTSLINIRVQAFAAEDARMIAEKIVERSSDRINELSAIAREDSTRYARDDLEHAVDRLKKARSELTQFRSSTQIVDPNADLQGQMGILNSLASQLAESKIELSLLLETSRDSDPRVSQARRRIEVIEDLIAEERAKFGLGTDGERDTQDYSSLVGQFESLMVDLQYAEQSYLSAQTALDNALAEAQRKSRYVATYNAPTLAQSPRYPERELIMVLVACLSVLCWGIAMLIYYSLRDRR